MFQELPAQNFDQVRPLFQGFDYSLSIQAALAGNSPGHIFVDDLHQPRAALALTIEGYLLAGDPADAALRLALQRFLEDQIFTGKSYVGPDWWMSLAVHPAQWADALPALIPTHEAEKVLRYHYQCDRVSLDWRAQVPAGYQVHPLNALLRGEIVAEISEALYDEFPLEAYWGTTANFMAQGVGFCAVQQGQVVALCKANCVAGDQVEVGVHTLPAHRRRGLSTAVTAATVAHSFEKGFRRVSWQCDSDNMGSRKTAEKVGFEEAQEYYYYCYIYDVGAQYAQLGWRAFHTGDAAKCVRYYEQAFALSASSNRIAASDYYYAAAANAAQGNKVHALRYLDQAIQRGWKAVDRTRQTRSFQQLFSEAEWTEILARMAE